jgi:hypothetical protein
MLRGHRFPGDVASVGRPLETRTRFRILISRTQPLESSTNRPTSRIGEDQIFYCSGDSCSQVRTITGHRRRRSLRGRTGGEEREQRNTPTSTTGRPTQSYSRLDRARLAGCSGIHHKPCSPDRVLAEILTVLAVVPPDMPEAGCSASLFASHRQKTRRVWYSSCRAKEKAFARET